MSDHVVVFGERHLRHVLFFYMHYYKSARTHLSQNKFAPLPRAVQAVGRILPTPILGRLHHHYVWGTATSFQFFLPLKPFLWHR